MNRLGQRKRRQELATEMGVADMVDGGPPADGRHDGRRQLEKGPEQMCVHVPPSPHPCPRSSHQGRELRQKGEG